MNTRREKRLVEAIRLMAAGKLQYDIAVADDDAYIAGDPLDPTVFVSLLGHDYIRPVPGQKHMYALTGAGRKFAGIQGKPRRPSAGPRIGRPPAPHQERVSRPAVGPHA